MIKKIIEYTLEYDWPYCSIDFLILSNNRKMFKTFLELAGIHMMVSNEEIAELSIAIDCCIVSNVKQQIEVSMAEMEPLPATGRSIVIIISLFSYKGI
jgi:hypothetical protein